MESNKASPSARSGYSQPCVISHSYYTARLETLESPRQRPLDSATCQVDRYGFYAASNFVQITPLPTPKRLHLSNTVAHVVVKLITTKCVILSTETGHVVRGVRDPYAVIMTIGIWSCCYSTVVHVFTLLLARVLS